MDTTTEPLAVVTTLLQLSSTDTDTLGMGLPAGARTGGGLGEHHPLSTRTVKVFELGAVGWPRASLAPRAWSLLLC